MLPRFNSVIQASESEYFVGGGLIPKPMSSRRDLRWLPVLATFLVLSMALVSAAEARKFRGIVTCGGGVGAPDSVCFGGDLPGASFQAFRGANVTYRICIYSPGGSRCKTKTTGKRGERSLVPINAHATGVYNVTWKVRGKIVARYSYRVKPENA